MSLCLLSSFAIVLFGMNDGSLGQDCNIRYSDSCAAVFRARSTCFSSMMWIFVFFAWELVDMRRSFLDGAWTEPRAWALKLWSNGFLFWSVIAGTVGVVPTLYIPVINHDVFLHYAIGGREWGIVIAVTTAFFAGAESWKWSKRVYLRRAKVLGAGGDESEEDLESMAFEKFSVL